MRTEIDRVDPSRIFSLHHAMKRYFRGFGWFGEIQSLLLLKYPLNAPTRDAQSPLVLSVILPNNMICEDPDRGHEICAKLTNVMKTLISFGADTHLSDDIV